MERIRVEYKAGPSRLSETAVDYMLAEVDGVELYAEAVNFDEDELATYEELKQAIIEQAKAHGIDPERLLFWLDI